VTKVSLILCCFVFGAAVTPPSASNHPSVNVIPDTAFDIYGNICWEDEKARLDNFAIQLQDKRELVGLMIVYAGRRSCANEAKSRLARAKKWLEGRGVSGERVVLRDGGYREKAETWLWVIPRNLNEKYLPIQPDLESYQVTIFRGCRGKIHKPAKCAP
jgi:hypothetical protein